MNRISSLKICTSVVSPACTSLGASDKWADVKFVYGSSPQRQHEDLVQKFHCNLTLGNYVVSAVNSSGESADSPAVSVRPTSALTTPLNLSFGSGQLQFTWAQDHTGWLLQAQTNSLGAGLGTNWAAVGGSDSTNQISLPIGLTNGSVFFRLVYP